MGAWVIISAGWYYSATTFWRIALGQIADKQIFGIVAHAQLRAHHCCRDITTIADSGDTTAPQADMIGVTTTLASAYRADPLQ